MAAPVTVPRLGWSMEEGTFVEWLKRDGEAVRPGEPLFVLESEKAAENIEAIDAGILRIAADAPQPGDVVPVGRVLAYLVADGEAVPQPAPRAGGVSPLEAPAISPATRGLTPPAQGSAVRASPRARRVARELGVDCATLQGSGRNGRARERDVRAAATGGRLIPHTRIRRATAAAMIAGVTEAAPVTLTTRADATELVAQRGRLKAAGDRPVASYTDLVVLRTAAALRQHPLLQAQWREDSLLVPDAVHIAIAVDTEAGLLVPVLRDADRLSVAEVAAQSRELIALARAGRLSAEQMRRATFTVTSLGMFGVDAFTPIIHLPQCAILGVGRIVREPAVVGDQVVPRDMLTLSLTFDHRVIDGAPAARFLDALRQSIEQPAVEG